ncbi:MAG: hypothetical protein NTX03_12760 [Bacteroidetes bacterium]|nr:hypothetical protein [Bacteroidota bacterium]
MKKYIINFMVALAVLFSINIYAGKKLITKPSKDLELVIKGEGGARGSAVAYNPKKRLYYAVICGNETFPLETFDEQGHNLFSTQAGFDVRGMWWNPNKKRLEANGYGEYGLAVIGTNASGFATGKLDDINTKSAKPNENSIGTLNYNDDEILYYANSYINRYGYDGKEHDYIFLTDGFEPDDVNENTVIYTGVKGMEIGLVDYSEGQVIFFNMKGEKYPEVVDLPKDDGLTISDAFKISFANDRVWFFNADNRTWTGYKIFE